VKISFLDGKDRIIGQTEGGENRGFSKEARGFFRHQGGGGTVFDRQENEGGARGRQRQEVNLREPGETLRGKIAYPFEAL